MKKAIALFLALLLLPTTSYVQPTTSDLDNRMVSLRNLTTKLNSAINHYTKCLKGACSPEEKQQRWNTVERTLTTTVKVAIALFILLFIVKKLGTKIHEKRKTLKVDKASTEF